MRGFITRKDLLRHPIMVIRNFGVVLFVKALFSKNRPFLDFIQSPASKIPVALKPYASTMDAFSYFERRIAGIFLLFAEKFKHTKKVHQFYKEISRQKMGRYALLQFVKSFTSKRQIKDEKWQPHLPRIERLENIVSSAEERIKSEISLNEALQITQNLVFSDLNIVYIDLKDSIYSRRAQAVGNLLLSERHFISLCEKRIDRLQKLPEAQNRLNEEHLKIDIEN